VSSRRPASIRVLGLGPGDPQLLTVAVRDALAAAHSIWVRTARHPAVAALPAHLEVRACDDLYEAHDSLPAVYRAIADRLLAGAREGPVLYGVPGDPTVGETTVGLLRRAAAEAGLEVEVLAGVSFVGPTLDALGWDALDGLQLADATELAGRHYPSFDPDRPALVAQVHSRLVASDLKLTLLAGYPPDHPVTLVSGAGGPAPRVTTMPLADLDRTEAFDDVSTLAVPALARPGSLLGLAEVVGRLRAPDGCPWDREQTHESLRPYLLEEAYEALEALDAGDPAALAEELGDLLLQVVLHAQLAAEGDAFRLADVVGGITAKIVRRHPHVFGDVRADTSAEVRSNWEALKREERAGKDEPDDPFAGLPAALPALARAQAVQQRAAGRAGLAAAPTAAEARLVVTAVLARGDSAPARPEERLGDALWDLVALARVWDVDAESSLREATARFQREAAEAPTPATPADPA